MPKELVILVNEKDKPIGVEEKLKAHLEGKLHRCFSILILNSKGEILIQKRAETKYHSPGLWSNTCCSHPRPNETLIEATKRRLKEEMGIETDLNEIFKFSYRAKIGNLGEEGKPSSSPFAATQLIENEIDHVFFGRFDGNPILNKNEVEDWRWMNLEELKKDIKENPEKYTIWFKRILDLYENKFKSLL